jgi:hypothetical protein
VLAVRERVSGAEHPETLGVRAGLAAWTGAAGDWAGARDQFAALLPVIERIFGAEHATTLAARGDLAAWTGAAGDRAGPGTSSPRCCRSASASPAPSTLRP